MNNMNVCCFVLLQVPEPIKAKKTGGHGHSHDPSQMNMRGAFLHVLSDALGSVIVVISALVSYTTMKVLKRNYLTFKLSVFFSRLSG